MLENLRRDAIDILKRGAHLEELAARRMCVKFVDLGGANGTEGG